MTNDHVDWNYPTRMVVGAGRVNELPELCQSLGIRKPLIVTDPGLASLAMVKSHQHCLRRRRHA